VTRNDRGPLRIALLHDGSAGGSEARELAAALRAAGHHPRLLSAQPADPAEALLRRRGFAGRMTAVPLGVAALLRGGFDVAHAFSPADALTARLWRRLVGRPAAFTCAEPLDRDRLADRRLRLWLLQRAVGDSDAVIAATEESRAALARWLALDAPVIESRDAAAYERLYRKLLAGGDELPSG
jgi:hypothetical protein